MTTESIDIRIREDGSRTVSRNIEEIGNSADRSSDRLRLLQSVLGALAGYLAISKITQYSDAWTRFEGLVATSTKSLKENLAVQKELYKIAQNNGMSIDALGDLYSRLARSGKELGTSQNKILQFTDLVSKSLSVQGTSAQQASGALMQMGQALGSGVVRAEEFNSMLEGAPIMLQFVAQNIDGVDGSIAKLRQRMIAGQLTSKEFFDAYLKAAPQIEEAYGKTSMTFSNGMTVFENGLKKFFGQMNSAYGISNLFFKLMQVLANNLDILAIALGAVAVGVAVAFAPGAVIAFGRAIVAVFALITAHPLAALATVIAGLIMYCIAFGDELLVTSDKMTTLADVGHVVFEDLKSLWNGLGEVVSDVWDYLFMVNADGNSAMLSDTVKTNEGMSSSWGGFFSDIDSGFMGFLQGSARVIDAIAGLLTGLGVGVVRVFGGIPGVVINAFNAMYNKVAEIIENTINMAVNGLNRVRSAVGMDLVEAVKIDRKNVDAKSWENYGKGIGESIQAGFEIQGGFLENYVKGVTTRAQKYAKTKDRSGSGVNLDDAMGVYKPADPKAKKAKSAKTAKDKSAEEAEKALKKLKGEYEKVLGIVDPLQKVQDEYNKDLTTLNKALEAGLVTQDKYNQYVARLKDHYSELLDPLGKLKRDIGDQNNMLHLSSKQMEIESQLKTHVEKLKKDGVYLTQEQNQALREQLELQQQLTEQQQLRSQLEQQADSISGRTELKSINMQGDMLAKGQMNRFDSNSITSDRISNMGLDGSGTAEGMDAQAQKFQMYYEQLNAMREQDLISEQTYSALKLQVWNQEQATKLQTAQSFLGSLAGLQNSNSKKMARIGKAAAIAQAVINTYQSATSAYAAMAGIPYVGPALGVAAAAAAVAAGMANVQAIRKQNVAGYMNGGYTGNGGIGDIAGFVHGQEYVFDAQTTSNLGTDNLDALRRGQMSLTPTNSTSQEGQTVLNVTIENNGSYKDYEVQQLSETDVRIIARDEAQNVVTKQAGSVVARELSNANSAPSKALSRNTTTERSRA